MAIRSDRIDRCLPLCLVACLCVSLCVQNVHVARARPESEPAPARIRILIGSDRVVDRIRLNEPTDHTGFIAVCPYVSLLALCVSGYPWSALLITDCICLSLGVSVCPPVFVCICFFPYDYVCLNVSLFLLCLRLSH